MPFHALSAREGAQAPARLISVRNRYAAQEVLPSLPKPGVGARGVAGPGRRTPNRAKSVPRPRGAIQALQPVQLTGHLAERRHVARTTMPRYLLLWVSLFFFYLTNLPNLTN